MDIRLHSYDLLMNQTYERIMHGIYYDNNLKLYSKVFLNKVLNYFEQIEDYEKCSVLQDIIIKRFDHENNFKTPYYEIR
jgi:hypothetical protein